jgi:CRAL/TRIO domain
MEFLVLQLRAVWYVFEVMAQENKDMNSSFVLVELAKDITIWDYDPRLHDRIIYFDKACWPVKCIASHICCAPSIFLKIIKPIINALMGKRNRARQLLHDVPESQLLEVLSDYGIHKEMLPTEMGGTVELDQAEWIAKRRAAELMEI